MKARTVQCARAETHDGATAAQSGATSCAPSASSDQALVAALQGKN